MAGPLSRPRAMRVATLSAGYADGYPRHLSNRDAAVLVRGQRCALLGRVTMDLMMIDVSDVEAAVGDEVVLMGRQGEQEISGDRTCGPGSAPLPGKSRRGLGTGCAGVCVDPTNLMFQIIFNELSAAEMAALPKTLQLDLLAEFQILPEDLDHLDAQPFWSHRAGGKETVSLSRQRLPDLFRETRRRISPSIASCTRTPSAIFFSAVNCPWPRTTSSGRRESFGN